VTAEGFHTHLNVRRVVAGVRRRRVHQRLSVLISLVRISAQPGNNTPIAYDFTTKYSTLSVPTCHEHRLTTHASGGTLLTVE
jgi:hypothetical protein